MNWSGGLAEWVDGNTAFISVAFSWKLSDAYQRSVWYRSQGYRVRAGGPGTFARPAYLQDVAEIGGEIDAITHHNAEATFASRGCPVGCYFCIVPKVEGRDFRLLPDFIPRPILCDNNLSALPFDYQRYIINKYKASGVTLVDANSGFEPRTFTEEVYRAWKEIYRGRWRLAYDETSEEEYIRASVEILRDENGPNKRIYVLIGNEPFEACLRRVTQVIEWGCEPHVQPMIALNALEKKPMIRYDWTEQKLRNLARWANRWIYRTIPFSEYKTRAAHSTEEQEQLL